MDRRLLPMAAFAAVIVVGWMSWPFTVDDSFIVARYARHLVTSHAWVMNPGAPTDGVTAPLWVLPMWVGEALGFGAMPCSKAVGLLGAAWAAAWAVAHAERRAARATGRGGAALVTAVLVSVQASTGVWAVGGLSTGAATFLTLAATLSSLHRPRPRPWLAGGCIALLAWLRPELAFVGCVLVGAVVLRDRRAGWIVLGVAATGACTVMAFRAALFGELLPLSFHAKPPDPVQGALYVLRAAGVITGGAGVLLALRGVREGRFEERVIGAVLGAHMLALVLAGGDWMPGFRLVAPVVPLYAMLAGVGATAPFERRASLGLVMILLVPALCVPAVDLAVQLPRVRQAGRARQVRGARLARRLAARARTVALIDVGYLAWASGVEVVDLGGVTEPVVAYARGGYLDKTIDPGWLAFRDPDVVLLHAQAPPRVDDEGRLITLSAYPVERRLARSAWLRAHYRVDSVSRYAEGYYYVMLVRRTPRAQTRAGHCLPLLCSISDRGSQARRKPR